MISGIAIWISVMIIYVPTYPSTQRDMVPFAIKGTFSAETLVQSHNSLAQVVSNFFLQFEAHTIKRCDLSSVFCSQLKETEREYFLGKDFVLDVGLSFISKSKSEEMCEIRFLCEISFCGKKVFV